MKHVEIINDKLHSFKHPDKVLVGDIVVINSGTTVPADGILFHSSELLCEEFGISNTSSKLIKNSFDDCMTQVNKLARSRTAQMTKWENAETLCPSPVLLSGSHILKGSGLMVACSVGARTIEEKKREGEEEEDDLTPL
jgi:magnesium-transporting ATPase (P-type)